MQIFGLHHLPAVAAYHHCDKHVGKLSIEAGQLLFAALRKFPDPLPPDPYKDAYANHPLTWWTAGCQPHFDFVLALGMSLCEEHELRYGHGHRTRAALVRIQEHLKTQGYPATMPETAPSPVQWKQWARSLDTRGDKDHFADVQTATVEPPQGCKFGVVAINKELPVVVDDNWVATYRRYYRYRSADMSMKFTRPPQDIGAPAAKRPRHAA
jgi:hypothetical protein